MFFIMGIDQGRKQLLFDQLMICKCCQRYGHIQVFITYTCLSLFFIPVFKWGKRYQVQMSCCNAVCELDPELGKAIERGEVTRLDEDILKFHHQEHHGKQCGNCGYYTTEDFTYCPKCGKSFY